MFGIILKFGPTHSIFAMLTLMHKIYAILTFVKLSARDLTEWLTKQPSALICAILTNKKWTCCKTNN